MSITYRADGVDRLPFLGVVFTHSDQPVAFLVYDSISESELAVFWGEWLDVTSAAGQLCFVQPLVSAGMIQWLRVGATLGGSEGWGAGGRRTGGTLLGGKGGVIVNISSNTQVIPTTCQRSRSAVPSSI